MTVPPTLQKSSFYSYWNNSNKSNSCKMFFLFVHKKCFIRNPVKWINSNFHSSNKTQMTNIFQGPLSSKVFFWKWVTSKCMEEEFEVKRRRKLFINKNFPILSSLSLFTFENCILHQRRVSDNSICNVITENAYNQYLSRLLYFHYRVSKEAH